MEHFLKIVDEVTVKDIQSIVQKLLSSPLTMASYGDGNLIYISIRFSRHLKVQMVILVLFFSVYQLSTSQATILSAAGFKRSEVTLAWVYDCSGT